ncbi:Rad9/Ddc1, partial [Geopyxis carbonaria]
MTVLNFSLSPEATQRVHSALICLSKFSESISLEALPKQLSLSALNSSKSACGAIDLDARRFFSSYTFVPDATAAEPRFTCRLQAKALLAVFRQRYVDSKDKATAIDRCELELRDRGAECRLLVRLSCRHGVLKTYKLTYEAHDVLRALFDAALARNRWRISSTQLKAYMEHFGPKTEQLDFSATNGRAAFTSFTERLLDGKEILKQPLQTSVALDTTDFDEFEVEEGVHVAIAMKDFRAVTLHAESLGAPLEARYSQPGRPLQLHYGAPEGLEARFTLMTLLDTRAVA